MERRSSIPMDPFTPFCIFHVRKADDKLVQLAPEKRLLKFNGFVFLPKHGSLNKHDRRTGMDSQVFRYFRIGEGRFNRLHRIRELNR